jgi:hypothetical protein
MADRLILAVNGYGAAEKPEEDGNTTRYLSYISDFCQWWQDRDIELHLLGGNTNRLSVTEARAMERWFHAHGLPENVIRVVLHEDSTDLRGNCEALEDLFEADDEVYYFCEHSRWKTTRFLVTRYLGAKVEVVPVRFDEPSMRLRHRLVQRFPKYWIEWSAETLGGPFERLRKYLRARHIAKHRKLAKEAT